MDEKVIPEIVAQFLLEKVESIAELEGLLILHRHPGRIWSARSLADLLYVREEESERLLNSLCEKRLAVMDTRSQYTYRPETPELGTAVDLLAGFYPKHIVPVTKLIHSKPKHKVQGFADAFKFRKEE